MSQVTIYLPPEVEAKARREARKAKKSLSSWIAGLVTGQPPAAGRAKAIAKLFGAIPELQVPDDSDLLPLDEP